MQVPSFVQGLGVLLDIGLWRPARSSASSAKWQSQLSQVDDP